MNSSSISDFRVTAIQAFSPCIHTWIEARNTGSPTIAPYGNVSVPQITPMPMFGDFCNGSVQTQQCSYSAAVELDYFVPTVVEVTVATVMVNITQYPNKTITQTETRTADTDAYWSQLDAGMAAAFPTANGQHTEVWGPADGADFAFGTTIDFNNGHGKAFTLTSGDAAAWIFHYDVYATATCDDGRTQAVTCFVEPQVTEPEIFLPLPTNDPRWNYTELPRDNLSLNISGIDSVFKSLAPQLDSCTGLGQGYPVPKVVVNTLTATSTYTTFSSGKPPVVFASVTPAAAPVIVKPTKRPGGGFAPQFAHGENTVTAIDAPTDSTPTPAGYNAPHLEASDASDGAAAPTSTPDSGSDSDSDPSYDPNGGDWAPMFAHGEDPIPSIDTPATGIDVPTVSPTDVSLYPIVYPTAYVQPGTTGIDGPTAAAAPQPIRAGGDLTSIPIVSSNPGADAMPGGIDNDIAPHVSGVGAAVAQPSPQTIVVALPGTTATATYQPGADVVSIAGITLSRNGPAGTLRGATLSVGSAGLAVAGSSTVALPIAAPNAGAAAPVVPVTVGGQTYNYQPGASAIDLGTTQISAQGPAATLSNGQVLSWAPSGIVVAGTSVIPLATPGAGEAVVPIAGNTYTYHQGDKTLVVGSETITANGAAATVNGQVVSIGNSGVYVSGKAVAPVGTATYSGIFAVGGQTYTYQVGADKTLDLGSTKISLGGAPATVDGQIVSVGSTGIQVVGPMTTATYSGTFTVGGQEYTYHSGDKTLDIGSTKLSVGGSPVTVNGQTISLGSAGVVVATPGVSASPTDAVFTVSGQAYTYHNGDKTVALGSMTITSGGAAATISGQVVTFGSGGLVVGSSTVVPASDVTVAAATTAHACTTCFSSLRTTPGSPSQTGTKPAPSLQRGGVQRVGDFSKGWMWFLGLIGAAVSLMAVT